MTSLELDNLPKGFSNKVTFELGIPAYVLERTQFNPHQHFLGLVKFSYKI